jgi:hypothetical protein
MSVTVNKNPEETFSNNKETFATQTIRKNNFLKNGNFYLQKKEEVRKTFFPWDGNSSRKVIKCWKISFSSKQTKRKIGKAIFLLLLLVIALNKAFCTFPRVCSRFLFVFPSAKVKTFFQSDILMCLIYPQGER